MKDRKEKPPVFYDEENNEYLCNLNAGIYITEDGRLSDGRDPFQESAAAVKGYAARGLDN